MDSKIEHQLLSINVHETAKEQAERLKSRKEDQRLIGSMVDKLNG